MGSLLGVELPTPVNFIIAFVFVLLLIGAAAWMVRRFGVTRIDAAARGRQPRLAVVDSAAVDGRRKLVIIRRDNVEHLLMIGGPSDVVVETNIVRGAAVATRDTPAAVRSGNGEMPRGVSFPDATPWPLQPDAAPASPPPPPVLQTPRPAPRIISADDAWDSPIEPPAAPSSEVRPPRSADTLAGLADELARPISEPPPVRPPMQPPRVAAPQPTAAASAPQQPQVMADQSLAEMAQRLEAALRRPTAQKIVTETQRVTATLDVKAVPQNSVSQPRAGAPAKSGNIEQEMASLLSRPGKT